MEKNLGAQPPADETTDWEAAVRQIFEQMAQADARIRGYQAEIDQLVGFTLRASACRNCGAGVMW
jgi:hypothetical protein